MDVIESGSPTIVKPAARGVVILTASVAALGGLLFGYDTSVISGAMLFLCTDFRLTDTQLRHFLRRGTGACGLVVDFGDLPNQDSRAGYVARDAFGVGSELARGGHLPLFDSCCRSRRNVLDFCRHWRFGLPLLPQARSRDQREEPGSHRARLASWREQSGAKRRSHTLSLGSKSQFDSGRCADTVRTPCDQAYHLASFMLLPQASARCRFDISFYRAHGLYRLYNSDRLELVFGRWPHGSGSGCARLGGGRSAQ